MYITIVFCPLTEYPWFYPRFCRRNYDVLRGQCDISLLSLNRLKDLEDIDEYTITYRWKKDRAEFQEFLFNLRPEWSRTNLKWWFLRKWKTFTQFLHCLIYRSLWRSTVTMTQKWCLWDRPCRPSEEDQIRRWWPESTCRILSVCFCLFVSIFLSDCLCPSLYQ